MTIGFENVGREVRLVGAQFQCAHVPSYRKGQKKLTKILTLDTVDESEAPQSGTTTSRPTKVNGWISKHMVGNQPIQVRFPTAS